MVYCKTDKPLTEINMPIKIPNDLPAVKTFTDENIFVMTQQRAESQQIRPLEIVLLNLMPTKIATETQLSRLLGNTPLQVKQSVVGYGRADKKQVQEMTRQLLGLSAVPKPDDTADALAIAICHAHSGASRLAQYYNK